MLGCIKMRITSNLYEPILFTSTMEEDCKGYYFISVKTHLHLTIDISDLANFFD